jgi:RNA polymerase sigma-70 factor, ECF subfamily
MPSFSSNDTEDERVLIAACAGGDAKAWDAFMGRYGRLITATASRVRSKYDARQCEAQDMAAFVHERLLVDDCRRLRAWRGKSKFSTYLVQITKNLCVDYVRTHNRDLVVSNAADAPEWIQSPALAPESAFEESEIAALTKAIDRLPDKQAMIMRLRLDGKSLRDIAEFMRIPQGTAFVENSRALERLRRTMKNTRG